SYSSAFFCLFHLYLYSSDRGIKILKFRNEPVANKFEGRSEAKRSGGPKLLHFITQFENRFIFVDKTDFPTFQFPASLLQMSNSGPCLKPLKKQETLPDCANST